MKAEDFDVFELRKIITGWPNGSHFWYGDNQYILVYNGATVAIIKPAGAGNKREIKIKF
jgi:hypothetical protein